MAPVRYRVRCTRASRNIDIIAMNMSIQNAHIEGFSGIATAVVCARTCTRITYYTI